MCGRLSEGGWSICVARGRAWLLLRRGARRSPRVTGAAAGLLAGLVTTSAQEIYCPILDASHILTWHLGVALLGASIGLAADSPQKPPESAFDQPTVEYGRSSKHFWMREGRHE